MMTIPMVLMLMMTLLLLRVYDDDHVIEDITSLVTYIPTKTVFYRLVKKKGKHALIP